MTKQLSVSGKYHAPLHSFRRSWVLQWKREPSVVMQSGVPVWYAYGAVRAIEASSIFKDESCVTSSTRLLAKWIKNQCVFCDTRIRRTEFCSAWHVPCHVQCAIGASIPLHRVEHGFIRPHELDAATRDILQVDAPSLPVACSLEHTAFGKYSAMKAITSLSRRRNRVILLHTAIQSGWSGLRRVKSVLIHSPDPIIIPHIFTIDGCIRTYAARQNTTVASFAQAQRNLSELEADERSYTTREQGGTCELTFARDMALSTSIDNINKSERRESLDRINCARERRHLHVGRLRTFISLKFPYLTPIIRVDSTWEKRMMKRHHTRKMAVSYAHWISSYT